MYKNSIRFLFPDYWDALFLLLLERTQIPETVLLLIDTQTPFSILEVILDLHLKKCPSDCGVLDDHSWC